MLIHIIKALSSFVKDAKSEGCLKCVILAFETAHFVIQKLTDALRLSPFRLSLTAMLCTGLQF